jgi:para-aminobenzoate synthetase component 1
MTGAPKISAMKIIDDLEETKEDYTAEQWVIYAKWNFDFNVIIRVFYTIKKISMYPFCRKRHNSLVNSENEYEECLLKAKNTCVRFCN